MKFQGFQKGDMVDVVFLGKHELTAEIAIVWSNGVSVEVPGEAYHTFKDLDGRYLKLNRAEQKQLTLF